MSSQGSRSASEASASASSSVVPSLFVTPSPDRRASRGARLSTPQPRARGRGRFAASAFSSYASISEWEESGTEAANATGAQRVLLLKLVCATLLLVVGFLVAVIVFAAKERIAFGNATYLATVTVTTIGYGDVVPHSTAGKVCAHCLARARRRATTHPHSLTLLQATAMFVCSCGAFAVLVLLSVTGDAVARWLLARAMAAHGKE